MNADRRLLLIGGGGHCRSVLDCALSMACFTEIAIIDKDSSASALNIPVIGADEDLPKMHAEGWTDAFVSVGSVGTTELRRKLYKMIKNFGFNVPIIKDPSASVAREVEIKEGVFLGKQAVVNTGSKIGELAILNTGAIIEHDCVIGAFAHISPGTVICGQVQVGDDSHIGAGSVVRQGINIGSNVLIGAGSVIVKGVPDNVKAYGNPCRVVE